MTKKDDNSPAKNANAINVKCTDKEKQEDVFAKVFLSPEILAASTIKAQYPKHEQININALITELSSQSEKIKNNDLGRAETMLIAQAHTLDALFAELVGRSRLNMGEYFNAADKYMRLALKTQGQCRATLETLAAIKNPQPFIQNNKAQYQQVNNNLSASGEGFESNTCTHAHAGKNSEMTNELLEDKTNEQEWLDTGTSKKAIGDDSELETVGA